MQAVPHRIAVNVFNGLQRDRARDVADSDRPRR